MSMRMRERGVPLAVMHAHHLSMLLLAAEEIFIDLQRNLMDVLCWVSLLRRSSGLYETILIMVDTSVF